jgi:hypothetical protein
VTYSVISRPPITALRKAHSPFLARGVLLDFGGPCQLRSLAGQEHDRTISSAHISNRLLDDLVGGRLGIYPIVHCSASIVALVEGSYLRMQKHSDRTDQPMLPVVRDNDCDALYLLLVALYEPSMIFKRCNILPAVESGGIN